MSTPQVFKTVDVLRLEVERDPVAGEFRNLIVNPSGRLGGWGWVTPVPHSVLRSANDASTGNAQGLNYITGTTISPTSNYFYTELIPATAGHYYRSRVYSATSPYGTRRAYFYWYNASRSFISSQLLFSATIDGQHNESATWQAPAGTAYVAYVLEVGASGGTYPYTSGGAVFGFREAQLVTATTATPLNSVNWANVAQDGFWTNILAPAHEIEIERESLDLGTLEATVLDATIDPATATLLRPGRRVRVTALNGTTSTWDTLFAGELLAADVTYDLKRKRPTDPKHARITLSAVDETKDLAQASRPEGVALIRDLPFVLEGAGVPWVADGNTNQVPSAGIASTNDNATALDQVALTRDTVRGYAWVNRDGVLNAFSSLPDPDVELIANPGFEVDLAGWSFISVGATGTYTRSTATPVMGTASLRFTAASGTTQMRAWRTTRVAVKPGTTYRFSAKARAGSTTRKIPMYVDWWDANGVYLSTSGDDFNVATATNTTTATTYNKDVVAPPGAATAEPTLCVGVADSSTTMAAGEIHTWDDVSFRATTPVTQVDETAYADIDLSFDMDACINSIDYKWLVANTFTGETDEYHLTGYEDAASIAQWGRHHKTFTIHGSGANAAAHAADVFARNAQPVIRPGGVQLVAMKTTADVTARAFVDLYDLHQVINTSKSIDHKARVTTIKHTIAPDRWIIILGYANPTAVAAPQLLPPVQNGDPTGPPFLEAVYTPSTAAVGAAWVALDSWTVIESSQITISGSTITVARPGRYRIKATLVYDAAGTAGTVRGGRFTIGGTAMPYQTSPGYGAAAFASVEVDHTKRLAAGATLALEAYAGATVNLLGGTAGYGNTRIEIQFLGD